MQISRRHTLAMGVAILGGSTLQLIRPFAAMAQDGMLTGDTYATDNGEIVIHPVNHASFVMSVPGMVIWNDPVGGAEAYAGLPAPQLILITHEHGDHYDPDTLAAVVTPETRLLTNPAVYDMLPDDLKAMATAIANGESTTANDITIEAIPAYNYTEDRLQRHPQGRDNGYVLTVDGMRIYIAGDTEDVPEMRALTDIDIAFVPMNLPNTMSIEQAAAGVTEFAPAVVYPYHYGDSDIPAFAALVADAGGATEVVQGAWYA